MPEFVVRGNYATGEFLNSRRLYELLLLCEPFAEILNLVSFDVERGCDGPDREVLAGRAAALQDALLFWA